MTTYLEEEDECRVCRDTGSESEPLISPCKCDGSIRFVHEACLVKWLEIKKSETCELCGHKFKFAAIYRDDTPAILPCCEMFNAFFALISSRYKKFLKFIYCLFLWVVLLPIMIKWGFMVWEQDNHTFESVFRRMTIKFMWEDLQHGLFLMITTTVVVLALVAFTDFYRWRTEDQLAIDRAMQNNEQHLHDILAANNNNNNDNNNENENDGDENNNNNNNDQQHLQNILAANNNDDDNNDDENNNENNDENNNNNNDLHDILNEDPQQEEHEAQQQPMMAAQQQQQQQINNNNNNNDINNENGDFIDDGGGEMQLPLNALLGFDSHPLAAIRNMIFFWLFVSLVLVIFVAFPRGVGRGLLSSTFSASTLKSIMAGPVLMNTIHFFVGHTVIIGALVGLPYCSARWANQNLSSELAGNIVSYLSAVASVLKITVLFIFKMGIYPICLGLIWHASELDCFKDKIIHEWDMIENYPVTVGVAMHWVLGIGFMLIVTVVILELKEVLHPEVLNVRSLYLSAIYISISILYSLHNFSILIFFFHNQDIISY